MIAAALATLSASGEAQTPQQPNVADPAAGVWIDDTGDGAIEIAPCGVRMCGRIVWLKSPVDRSGQPLTDGYNPDPRMRRQAICGLQVIGDLKRMGGGRWDQGWIYDPKDGKRYDVEIRPLRNGRLQVTGYLGTKWLSETFQWTRAPADLKPCGDIVIGQSR